MSTFSPLIDATSTHACPKIVLFADFFFASEKVNLILGNALRLQLL